MSVVTITKGKKALTMTSDAFSALLSGASVGLVKLAKLEAERTPEVALAEKLANTAVEEMQSW